MNFYEESVKRTFVAFMRFMACAFWVVGLDTSSDLAFAQFDCLGSVLKNTESQE